MTPIVLRSIAAGCWLIVTYATLQIHRLDLHLGHGVCGPWGCGPPVEALIANHGFWLLVIVPPLSWIQQHVFSAAGWKLGGSLVAFGGICALALAAWDLYGFVSATRLPDDQFPDFWPQRALFALAVGIEFPTFHFAVAGLILLGCQPASARLVG